MNKWDRFHENVVSFICMKCYKIPLRLNHHNFRKVKAIDFLFSIFYTTPFLYGIKPFWSLALTCTPCQYCHVRYPIGFKPAITFCRPLFVNFNAIHYSRTVEQATLYVHVFLLDSRQFSIHASPYIVRDAICPNLWRES